jgi:hypothetical protein
MSTPIDDFIMMFVRVGNFAPSERFEGIPSMNGACSLPCLVWLTATISHLSGMVALWTRERLLNETLEKRELLRRSLPSVYSKGDLDYRYAIPMDERGH